jgi:23S rRNA C2498 (ribose-2'-O)-methylase RlmM
VAQAESQDPNALTLFCMLGKGGVFCGMQSPKDCNGFYPGGSKHVAIHTPDTISRAGAKIVEALHYLRLHREPPPERAHWLELGASPGGMTSELLDRGYRVTAIDPAPLDPRLNDRLGLRFFLADASTFEPPSKLPVDAMLCDMNGPPEKSLADVIRLSSYCAPKALVVFTLKLPRVESVDEALRLFDAIVAQAEKGGLHLFAQTHLTYNRQELTLFFEVVRDAVP